MNLQAMTGDAIFFSKGLYAKENKISSLWLTAEDGSIFLYPSTNSAHIFSDNSCEETLFFANYIVPAVVSSQILNERTIFYQLASSLLRMMMNLVLKGTKCGIIIMDWIIKD